MELVFEFFEAAWDEGHSPVLEDWLDEDDDAEHRLKLLQQLLGIELRWRRKRGQCPHPDEYIPRFPDAAERIEAAFAEFQRSVAAADAEAAVGGKLQSLADQQTSFYVVRAASDATEEKDKDAPRPVATSPPSTPGETEKCYYGRYRVDEFLGGGGFGKVYKAWDEQLQRPVAVKLMLPRSIPAENEEAFLAEARTVAQLDHPCIVPVYDSGQANNGEYFVVSKLIDGSDLASQIKSNPPSWSEAVAIVASIAEALHYAHTQGLVHRDVKPANILIDRQGRAYLADFGIALRDEELGEGPQYIGTFGYMSPEQVSGQGHHVDGRSDVFSLGVVLYELLTGKRPFRSSDPVDLMEQISSMEAKPPRQINDAIPPELEAICLKALAKNVNDRYLTAKDFADELRAAVSTDHSLVAGQTAPPRSTPAPSTRRWLLAAGVPAVILLASVTIISVRNWLQEPESPPTVVASTDSVTQPELGEAATELVQEFAIWASRGKGPFQPVERVVPLENGDHIRFSIRLNEPAYVRLVWIDAAGHPADLFPRDPEAGDRGDEPVSAVQSPVQLDRGWPVEGGDGIETALLLVSRQRLSDIDLSAMEMSLTPGMTNETVAHYVATRGDKPWVAMVGDEPRSLGKESRQVDDAVLQLLERLRQHTDVAMAVAIPHRSTGNE